MFDRPLGGRKNTLCHDPSRFSVVLSLWNRKLTWHCGVTDLCAPAGVQEVTADPDLVGMLTREELVRKVTQVYTLERLAVQDVATALPLLLALAQVNPFPEPFHTRGMVLGNSMQCLFFSALGMRSSDQVCQQRTGRCLRR